MAVIFEGRFYDVVNIFETEEDISELLCGWDWNGDDMYIGGILYICNDDMNGAIQLISKSSPYGYLYYIDNADGDQSTKIYRIEVTNGTIRKYLCTLTWDRHKEVL